jgi:rhodanese-related sulfurtransferase
LHARVAMSDAPRIGVDEARFRIEAEEAVLLDTNPPPAEGGPPDAIAWAWPAPPSELGRLVRRLPRGCLVITYCSCPSEHTSARVASLLREHGYEAFALDGGMAAWREAGYPIESREIQEARDPAELCPACGFPCHEHAGSTTHLVAPI